MSNPQSYIDGLRARGIEVTETCVKPGAAFFHPGPALDCSEKELHAAVCALATECGWRWYHVAISKLSKAGFPDWHALRGPRQLVWEFKREGVVVPAEQLAWLMAYRAAGVDARVMRPSDWPLIVETLTA